MRQMCINVSKLTRWGRTAAGIILPVNFINNNSLSDQDMDRTWTGHALCYLVLITFDN